MERPKPGQVSRKLPSQDSESEFNPDLTPLQRQGELAGDVYEDWYDTANPEDRLRRTRAPRAIEAYYRFLVVADQRQETGGAEPPSPSTASENQAGGEERWTHRAVESALDDLHIDPQAEIGPEELGSVAAALGVAADIAERIFAERPNAPDMPPRPFGSIVKLQKMIALSQHKRRKRVQDQ